MDTDNLPDPLKSGPLALKRLARQIVPDKIRETEARLLKAKYQIAKRLDPTLNQEKIADICGWAGQSVVSQYLNAKIPLNLSALVKFAGVLNFDPSDVSPRLTESHPNIEIEHIRAESPSAPQFQNNLSVSSREESDALRIVPFVEQGDPAAPREGEVALPFFREPELSEGEGTGVTLDLNGLKQIFAKSVLIQKNIEAEAAGCARVSGNSMVPVLPDGSIVGVDTSSRSVQDGKMYALDHDGLLHVKLLYRLPGGGLRLKSYNDAEHPDERYDGSYVSQHIRVLGKLFWYSVLL